MSKSLLLACLLLISCDKPDPNLVKLQVRAPKRLNECNVYLDSVRDDHEHGRAVRRAFLQTACGVPEAALRGQWWWGEGPQPPGFSLDVGDCMPLTDTYYCLEDLVHADFAAFRATYMKPEHPKGKLRRIR